MRNEAFMCVDGPFRGTKLLCFGDPKEGIDNVSAGWAFGHHARIHYRMTKTPDGWVWKFVDAQTEERVE